MDTLDKISDMKRKLISPEEIAKQKEKIEARIFRKENSPFHSIGYGTVEFIQNSDIAPEEKLSYFKKLVPLLKTEDDLFKLSHAIIDTGGTLPETRQQMFDTLKELAKYEYAAGDHGLPMSGMYERLHRLGRSVELKDSQSFAKNFLEIVNNELQSGHYKRNDFHGVDTTLRNLNMIIDAYPEIAVDVYNSYVKFNKFRNDEASYSDRFRPFVEAKLCDKIAEQLEKHAKNTDKIEKLNNRKNELEEQCWKNTHKGAVVGKSIMATYVETFPENAFKALEKVKNQVFSGNDKPDIDLRKSFETTAEKHPQFAESWNKTKAEHVAMQSMMSGLIK